MLDLYSEFASRLQGPQETAVLDAEDGLAASFAETLSELLEETTDTDIELERNTWDLIHALFSSRSQQVSQTALNPFLPPSLQAAQCIAGSRDLQDLIAIRDWLSSIAPDIHPAEVRRGYLPYTKNALKARLRAGQPAPRHLPPALDPDEVFRASGSQLEAEDDSYEAALMRTLFEYVRIGQMDTAIDMCRQSDQSWRAASLSGGTLYLDENLDGDAEDMEQDLQHVTSLRYGNLNRRLWKMTCQKLAASPLIKRYERALYGALSGDLNSVLPVCDTWEDHLWAHINHLLETKIDQQLQSLSSASFFSQLSLKLDHASSDSTNLHEDLAYTFNSLLEGNQEKIQLEARHPLRVAQSYIIQDQAEEMIENFVERMEAGADDIDDHDRANLLRFFAHFILFLRQLNKPVPSEASAKVLDAYVRILRDQKKDDLVALYASTLDSNLAIEAYAQFLSSISPQSDKDTRRDALFKCREAGMDLAEVAQRVVELIISEATQVSSEFDQSRLFNHTTQLDNQHIQLIRSLEWLTFDRTTYLQAHLQANLLIRWFLVSGQSFAAQQLIQSLPGDLDHAVFSMIDNDNDLDPLRNSSAEFDDYKQFFRCLALHEQCTQSWANRPSSNLPRFDQYPFVKSVKERTEELHATIVDLLLNSQWLKKDVVVVDSPEAEIRIAQLAAIRKIYVPELVFRLHKVLFETHNVIPQNLQKAIDMANIVADDFAGIYNDFMTTDANRMPEFMECIREACLASLDYSTNPFTVPAAI